MNFGCLPVDIGRTTQSKVKHAHANGRVCQPVNQDETTGLTVFGIRIEGYVTIQSDVANTNLV